MSMESIESKHVAKVVLHSPKKDMLPNKCVSPASQYSLVRCLTLQKEKFITFLSNYDLLNGATKAEISLLEVCYHDTMRLQ